MLHRKPIWILTVGIQRDGHVNSVHVSQINWLGYPVSCLAFLGANSGLMVVVNSQGHFVPDVCN